MKRLFELEVPEIYDGTVEIKSIAREAGSRTKMAVWSNDENVDPIGACVGPKGQRVGSIVEELRGEKIDIIKYSDTSWEFVLLLILFAEIVIFATKNPKFLMPRVLFGSLNDIISICIISLFVTFVMITGGIDIQAGSIVGLSSIVLGVAWQDGGMNIWAAVALAVVVAGVCGALSGYFVAYCGVQPMVVTLGGSFLFTGVALLVSNLSATESYKGISGFPDSFLQISKFKLFGVIPCQVIIFLVLAVIAYVLLNKTKYANSIFTASPNSQRPKWIIFSVIQQSQFHLSSAAIEKRASKRWILS